MLKKAASKGKPKSSGFKGFSLIDFLHPNTMKMEGVFKHPILQNAIANHIQGFNTYATRNMSRDRQVSATSTSVSTDGIGDVTPPASRAQPTTNAPTSGVSFEESLTDFLDGLYLGNFTSSVVQPHPQRPPIKYIYEIGVNTDKLTGFIVKNPFDTLITFGPRDLKYPYGHNVAIPQRIAKIPFVGTATSAADDACGKEVRKRPTKVTEHTTVSRPNKATKNDNIQKPPVVCDLNLRIIINSKSQLEALSMYGDTLKVHLSKGLVQTVENTGADGWVKTNKRVSLDMGKRIISLKKNRLPNWGGLIDLNGTPVSITSSGLIANLNKVNIGGTLEKPLIIFDQVEILK